jgi:GTP-binding protein
LDEAPAAELTESPLPVYRAKQDAGFKVSRSGAHAWRVTGASIERAASMTFWEHDGSVRRFQKIMEALGVDEALREAGIQHGDSVAIGNFELDWQD